MLPEVAALFRTRLAPFFDPGKISYGCVGFAPTKTHGVTLRKYIIHYIG